MPDDRPITQDDLAISLAVRQDLGREHDQAVIGEFLAWTDIVAVNVSHNRNR